MSEIKKEKYPKYFFIALLAVIAVLAVLVLVPYITSIVMGALLAYVFMPLHERLYSKIKNKDASAYIISLLIIIIIVVPFGFAVFELFKELTSAYNAIKESGILLNGCTGNVLCNAMEWLRTWLTEPSTKLYLEEGIANITSYIKNEALSFAFSIPSFVINVVMTFFICFFFLKDGKEIIVKIESLAPLKESHKKKIFDSVKNIMHSIIYGVFVMAVVEGILMGLTFKIAGIPSPIIWGVVVGILAFIPFLGAGIVWIPAAILQFYYGNTSAAIIVIVGGLIVFVADTFVKPYIIGDKSRLHPILILVGFLGGLKLFGFVGIFLGPLVLSLATLFFEMYKKEENTR